MGSGHQMLRGALGECASGRAWEKPPGISYTDFNLCHPSRPYANLSFMPSRARCHGREIFFFFLNLLQAGELLASRAKKKSSKCR